MLLTRYQKIDDLSISEIMRMHALFEAHYAFSPLSTFIQDLRKKDGAFIVRHKGSGEIVGFSTLGIYHFELGGRRAKGLFSGDTIIERSYWGSRSLQSAFAFKLFWEALKSPFTAQYWLLISKGYKTYLLLARNFPEYYPQRDTPDTGPMRELVVDYCEALFPGRLDRERMVLDFGEGANCLKDDVAVITEDMCRADPDIAFFARRNPDWQRGTELPCIARADLKTFLRFVWPFLWKAMRGRRPPQARAAADAGPRGRARHNG